MSDTRVVSITGTCRPSRRLRRMAQVLHGSSVANAVETAIFDAKAINALAVAMESAIDSARHPTTGLVDMKDAALHLIQTLRSNQR